jgi:hypothetical protein
MVLENSTLDGPRGPLNLNSGALFTTLHFLLNLKMARLLNNARVKAY